MLQQLARLAGQIVVQRLDKRITGNEVVLVLFPPRKHLLLLQLHQGFTLLDTVFYYRPRIFQHDYIGTHVIQV